MSRFKLLEPTDFIHWSDDLLIAEVGESTVLDVSIGDMADVELENLRHLVGLWNERADRLREEAK